MDSGVSSVLASLSATLRVHFLLIMLTGKNFTEKAEKKKKTFFHSLHEVTNDCVVTLREASLFSLFLKEM